jgi:hypothetical protein
MSLLGVNALRTVHSIHPFPIRYSTVHRLDSVQNQVNLAAIGRAAACPGSPILVDATKNGVPCGTPRRESRM